MIEIIINRSYKLDGFKPSEVIALTFAEAKFNNLVTRGGTFSNKIKLGKTVNNRQVLGFPEDNRETSSRPYTRFECEIKIGRNPVFYGVAILELAQDFYELRVFSGLADFFKLLNDKTLNQLDLSALNHNWTAANVRAASNVSINYCYPAINYGLWEGVKHDTDHYEFFPAVYFKYLLEKAASEIGWTLNNYDSNFGIPFSKKDFTVDPVCRVQIDNQRTIIGGLAGPYPLPDLVVGEDVSEHVISVTTVYGTGDAIELREGAVYDFTATVEYDCSLNGTVVGEFNIAEFKTSNNALLRLLNETVVINTSGTGSFTMNAFGVSRESVGVDSYVSILAGTFGVGSGSTFDVTDNTKLQCTGGRAPLRNGDMIVMSNTLPSIKCKDLFLFEAVRKNAIIAANPIDKTIELIPFDDVANRWGAAKDWSNKVDLTIKPKYEYRLSDFAQNNYLRWKEGSENEPAFFANPFFADYNLTVDDEGLVDEKTMYTAPFAASGVDVSFNENQHLRITRYTDSGLNYLEPDNNPVARCCKLQSSDENVVQIKTVAAITDQIQGTFDNWEQVVSDNYTSFEAMLNRLKLVTVQVNLTAEDIASLDFTYPVKMLGNYWFLQEVKQWKANKAGTTTVKAIRL
jgi:hypothetical protein